MGCTDLIQRAALTSFNGLHWPHSTGCSDPIQWAALASFNGLHWPHSTGCTGPFNGLHWPIQRAALAHSMGCTDPFNGLHWPHSTAVFQVNLGPLVPFGFFLHLFQTGTFGTSVSGVHGHSRHRTNHLKVFLRISNYLKSVCFKDQDFNFPM